MKSPSFAKGYKKARDIRMFFDKPQPCPFASDPDTTLFNGFNIPSEDKCFLALGWPLPDPLTPPNGR
jgi:hypothetical protein